MEPQPFSRRRIIVYLIVLAVTWGILAIIALTDRPPQQTAFVSPVVYRVYLPAAPMDTCPDRGGRWGVNLQSGSCDMLREVCADWYIANLGTDNQWPEGTCAGYTWGTTHLPYFAYMQHFSRWNERGWDDNPPARLAFGNEWDSDYWPLPSVTEFVQLSTPALESVLDAGGMVIGPFPAYGMKYAREYWLEFERQNSYLPPWDQVQLGIHCYDTVAACRSKIYDALAIHRELFGTPVDVNGLPARPVVLWGEYGSLVWGTGLTPALALDRDLVGMALTEPESRIVAGMGYYSVAHLVSDNVPCSDVYHCWKPIYAPFFSSRDNSIEAWEPVAEVFDFVRNYVPPTPTKVVIH